MSPNSLKAASVLGGLLLWQVAADWLIADPSLLVSPVAVLAKGGAMVRSGELLGHLQVSLGEFLWGYLLAIAAGIPLGYAMARSRRIHDHLNPWVTFLYTTPRIAFAPLLVLWFGIGSSSKIAIVFSGCLFPLLINTYFGFRAVDGSYLEVARSFKLSAGQLFFKVLIPGTLPFIFAGLRLAVGRGLVGVAVAEWFGATAGLGYLVYFAGQTFNVPVLFVGVSVFALLGILSFELLRRLEDLLAPWRRTYGRA